MLNLNEFKPDYEGSIEGRTSFKLIIFDKKFPNEQYFQGLIAHYENDVCYSVEPITGFLQKTSIEIYEEEVYGRGRNSIRYEFNFDEENLTPNFKIHGKQIYLSKTIMNVFHDSRTNVAIIWKC